MDYKEILSRFQYEDDSDIKNRISNTDPADCRINRDIINEIVLWKINRSVDVSDDLLDMINQVIKKIKTPMEAAKDVKVRNFLIQLLNSKGIQIAMASTIMHFYNPDVFPIIDQRSYRELVGKEMPDFYKKNKNELYADSYLDYIEKCVEYKNQVVPDAEFKVIDKILYQLDKEKKNKVKY